MLAASFYSPNKVHTLEGSFNQEFGGDRELRGLYAKTVVVPSKGTFARFDWADWPLQVTQGWAHRVKKFETAYQLQPLSDGSPEWNTIFRGCHSDTEAAREIAHIFQKHFGERLSWVMCSKDSRGRIGAQVNLKDSEGQEGGVQVGLDLSWKGTNAFGIGDEDSATIRDVLNEVSDWAGRRIKPILDALDDKVKALYGDRFRGLYVFGSYARPDAGIELPIDSDLDVALILSDFTSVHEERERFGDIVYDLSLEHGLAISVVPVREAEYRNQTSSFTREISSYAVPVR